MPTVRMSISESDESYNQFFFHLSLAWEGPFSMDKYKISLDDDLKLVRVIAYGELTKSIGKQIITEARNLAATSNYGIIYDVRKASVRVALADWFFLPRELEVLRTQPTRVLKVALLIPSEKTEEYKFYENVASNVGLSLKIFLDEDEALAWMR